MVMIDNAVYVEGRRVASPATLERAYDALRTVPNSMAWIGLYRPDPEELRSVATEFDIHELIMEDTEKGHQRSKTERYGDTEFTVLRPARYIDSSERVEFGEVHIITGANYAIVIRHSETPDLSTVRAQLEDNPERFDDGPDAVLFAVLDEIVDQYEPVVTGLENDVDEIEDALFAEGIEQSQRIYALLREVIGFQRAATPLVGVIETLRRGVAGDEPSTELRRRLRDVEDHVTRVVERLDGFRSLLQNALTANSALVGQRQNDETRLLAEAGLKQNEAMKKVSSWAAILFAPSLIGTVYGMNFDLMPELHYDWGYPAALGAMVLLSGGLWLIFRRNRWL